MSSANAARNIEEWYDTCAKRAISLVALRGPEHCTLRKRRSHGTISFEGISAPIFFALEVVTYLELGADSYDVKRQS